jgi:hypothetical protein
MTTHSVRPGADAQTAYDEAGHSGLLIYAAVLVGVLGLSNLVAGIAAIARSSVFVGSARYAFGDLRAWGWVMLILGALQLVAVLGLVARNQLARWFAVAVLAVNVLAQIAFTPSNPFWSLLIIAADVVALWALRASGGKEKAYS